MSNEDITLNINLRWGRTAQLQKNTADRPIQMAIENVGFRAAKNRQNRLKANLIRDFAPVVERELQSMASDVARMGLGFSNSDSPTGVLSVPGRISRPMIGNSGPMSISSMTGTWAKRTQTYMRWKMRKYRTRKWFVNTGQLQRQLRNIGTYRSAYGPVSIRFTPNPLGSGPAGGVSSLGRSSGGQSTRISIGRLEVNAFRKLRLGDLPNIGQVASYNERLMSPLASSVRRKLSGRKEKYRPVIEPFLTYYLTRRIPNAVYRRLEDSLA